ncbi:MAG TPA: AAA family ATPase [Gaiellaceae bacterium]|nr:AAA family ATPase [Gaiellaceae bacterium]
MLRIHAVGGFRVEVDGRERTSPTLDRATALLAWLALNPGTHPRSAVAARFWPDVLDDSARASLRSALWSLRRRLGEDANGALIATRDRVGLAEEVWVDVAEAQRLRADGRLDEALALCDGELLPGLEDEWACEARDEHRARTVALLEEFAAQAEGGGDAMRAIELSRRAAALEPLSEEAHRSLMRRLADGGDRAGALTVYSELRTRFLKTLRIGPSDETRELAESLRAPETERVPTQLKRVDRALFVGREAELARLRRLQSAVSETTRVGLIAGEAGSGKTRLAARFAVETATKGTIVLYGSCGEQALVPLEPFAEALGTRGEPGLDTALVEERLAAAPGTRLLLVLDDLQWADRVTLALLCRIVRGPLSSRLLVVGTYREDAADAHLYGALADIRRTCEVERIELGGLGLAEVAALIGSAFETSAAAAEARTIHNRTGGNPFYVRELARHVAERPATAFVDVPEGIRDVVRARMQRLPAGCPEALGAAAILGDSFEVAVLAAVSGKDEDEVQAMLDKVADAGLVEETSAGRYRFSHRLTRDAVYAGLGPTRRARLHASAATALGELHGLEPGRRLGEIALHRCEAAGEAGDAEAVDLAARAASIAMEEGAYEQAVALLTRALGVVPDGDVKRRRSVARQRALAFARLTHAVLDMPNTPKG